jgi:hypothetical protein
MSALVWHSFGDAFLHRERNRGEVLALYHAVQPGVKAAVVEDLRKSAQYSHLAFQGGEDRGWYISTPFEFGATNWVLVVDVADGHVTSVRVRTEDGLHDHPSQAPADKTLGSSARQEAREGRAVEQ